MLSQVSQKENDKYHMISLICTILKKITMNSQRTDWWAVGVGKIVKLVKRYRLPVIK